MMVTSGYPRIVVSGANSGVGKTTVSLALVAALRGRGLTVQTFKVGPDYLDPSYLSLASDRACYNLDGWMTGRAYVAGLLARAGADADICVIEGVMGLFDGADVDTLAGSTAEVAMWLEAPVLLVVNVHGVARTLAAIVKGFAEFESGLKLAGVVSNHCGSERHAEWLAQALRVSGLPRQLGGIPRGAFPELPSRHLGLVTADRGIVTPNLIRLLGETVERYVDVDAVLETARSAPPIREPVSGDRPAPNRKLIRVGLAYDAAFHFYYPDNLEAMEAAGCELVRFSPLEDVNLPGDLDCLYLGGGYPEEFARQLAENRGMLQAIREFAESKRAVYAECGGLMYLAQGIVTRDGTLHELVGLLPVWTTMLERLKALGYVEVTLRQDSLFGPEGSRLRGHEFHYSELNGNPGDTTEWTTAYEVRHRRAEKAVHEGYQKGRVLASYVHMHFASRPEAVEHFVKACLDR